MKTGDKNNKKNIIIISSFCSIVLILVFVFAYTIHSWSEGESNGKFYRDNGFYQKAADEYYKSVKLKKVIYDLKNFFKISDNDRLNREINELLLEVASCYSESGDLKRALKFYLNFLARLPKTSENEALINYTKLQTAICYSSLGYYDKALPIYEELKTWYPQNLILAYINDKDFVNAEQILFSRDVQDKIKEGDDIDAAYLSYVLLSYYKEIGQFEKADKNYAEEAPEFESTIISKIHYADLYFNLKNYDKSEQLYMELVNSMEFPEKIMNKLKLRYALVLNANGKQNKAEQVINGVLNDIREAYKYSPEIICAKYYLAQIDVSKSLEKDAKNLFSSLHLTKGSRFKNNIEEFCKINTAY